MTISIPPEYHDREQTYLKHRVLREYLRAWVQKLGSLSRHGPLTIFYVDCFAGPWRSAGQNHEDTSVAIGLSALSEAIDVWRRERGASLNARAVFVEADPQSASQLRAFVVQHKPAGIDAAVLEGTFEGTAATISTMIGGSPAFVFVDPTGWKGVGMGAVSGLARGARRDVMVNVMYDHINRFVDDEREFLRQQMQEFFDATLEPNLDENELMKRYRDQLRARSRLRFVADLAVPHPTRRRTYFRLVLATDHPKALELFRDVEHHVCGREAASVREGARRRAVEERTGQTGLDLDAPTLDADYARAHQDDLQASRETLVQLVRRAERLKFRALWPDVLERHHVTLADVKATVIELDAKELVWQRSGGPTQRKIRDDDMISTIAGLNR